MENIEPLLKGFLPVENQDAAVLILGSMPSVDSLRKTEYYGHARNHFWPILFELLGEEPTADYEQKKAMLLRHGIALWDVIASCRRQGSLDQNIRDAVPNEIPQFLSAHPNIKLVCFNGQTAQKTYDRFFQRQSTLPYLLMPSTSPVPRRHIKTMQDKLPAWRQILPYLEK